MVKKLVKDLDDWDHFLFENGGQQPGVVLLYQRQRIVTDMGHNLPGDSIEVLAWDEDGDAWYVYYRLDEEVEVVEND